MTTCGQFGVGAGDAGGRPLADHQSRGIGLLEIGRGRSRDVERVQRIAACPKAADEPGVPGAAVENVPGARRCVHIAGVRVRRAGEVAGRVLDAVRADQVWINPGSDDPLDARYASMKARRNPDYFRNWNPTTGE